MSTAADALAAANAATAAATTATARIDTMETQLDNIAQQLQVLIAAAGGGGVGGGGGGGGGVVVPPIAANQRRRIDPSGLEKLQGDVRLPQLRTWRNRWNDFCQLNQLATYPANEQTAALRMALDPSMQQVVEVALNILPTTHLTPDEILDQIADYVRAKRNIALDRVAFEEYHQSNTESFEDFYIRLRRLADAADLCATCVDARVATRIMAGIRDTETKRKLLALTPFPSAQQAINMCRSEEAARMNERSLSNQSSINHVRQHQRNDATAASCGSCGHNNHRPGEACPATGKTCHNCGGSNHFSSRCPKPRRSSSTGQSGGGTGKSEGAQPGSGGSSTGGFPPGPRMNGKIG
ncbi:hypothetical protein DAPPUDRAFT_257720 [Daphnia pulex]|uniref:CCHC-type domain-containing protein n=1 Tax=Daphnia pulex TaxID=6669 RepID=E9HE31_DAPPU|nr:hypothetical protein DAPPUDRAFT_257720 [Daphnia pulex]|eukprot:EFX69941.1 hypothetical protein DAPPUDRAFT_257720 [Daphnia pulex]